ncbi:hypothetical protein BU17DRAFT_43935 [Hysterangium stoloniferum]|nr:hypothetical protein BU17DRAFT_43935 [Hysterangium stoloniferum]
MYLHSPYPSIPPLPPTNYHNLLFRTPGQRALADHTMHIDAVTGQRRTRSGFIERVYDAATALGADKSRGGLGFGQGHMIGIMSDNCLEYITIVHALLVAATPMALFSPVATPREMTHYLRKSEATHMFLHPSCLATFLEVARETGFPEENIFILEGETPEPSRFKTLDSLIQNVRFRKIPREPVKPAGYDTLAYLSFSSGTSGLPKAVMISHGNLCVSLVQGGILMAEYTKLAPPRDPNVVPVILGILPMHHPYGLHTLCLRYALQKMSTVVVMPRWNVDLVLHCIPKYRVSSLALIPSMIHALVSSPKLRQTDLSSIVLLHSGAAYLPPILAEKMKDAVKGSLMMEGYGMSEATLSLIGGVQTGTSGGHHSASSGVLIPGVEGLLLREDGTHCLPNEAGDLYVKSGTVALGYWKDPKATREAFLKNGWLKTGDRFRADATGNLWFEDRTKDTLKVSGLQVSPGEIEDTILAEPTSLVNDVAVAGVQTPGARTSDDKSPRAWIVLSEEGRKLGEARSKEIIKEWTNKNLSKYKWLRGGIQVVDQIPKNITGKILRRVLQDQYDAKKGLARL